MLEMFAFLAGALLHLENGLQHESEYMTSEGSVQLVGKVWLTKSDEEAQSSGECGLNMQRVRTYNLFPTKGLSVHM